MIGTGSCKLIMLSGRPEQLHAATLTEPSFCIAVASPLTKWTSGPISTPKNCNWDSGWSAKECAECKGRTPASLNPAITNQSNYRGAGGSRSPELEPDDVRGERQIEEVEGLDRPAPRHTRNGARAVGRHESSPDSAVRRPQRLGNEHARWRRAESGVRLPLVVFPGVRGDQPAPRRIPPGSSAPVRDRLRGGRDVEAGPGESRSGRLHLFRLAAGRRIRRRLCGQPEGSLDASAESRNQGQRGPAMRVLHARLPARQGPGRGPGRVPATGRVTAEIRRMRWHSPKTEQQRSRPSAMHTTRSGT